MKWCGVYTQNKIDKIKFVNGIIDFQKSYRNQILFNAFLFKKYEGFIEEMSKIQWDSNNLEIQGLADEMVYETGLRGRLSVSRLQMLYNPSYQQDEFDII